MKRWRVRQTSGGSVLPCGSLASRRCSAEGAGREGWSGVATGTWQVSAGSTAIPSALDHQAEDAKLLVQVIEYYHQCLLQSPEALGYLEKRGIGSKEAIETFKLGFANRTLGYRLPASNRVEGAVIRGAVAVMSSAWTSCEGVQISVGSLPWRTASSTAAPKGS